MPAVFDERLDQTIGFITSIPFRVWLLVIFSIAFGISAIGPDHPRDFILEHTFTAALLGFLIWTDRRKPISNVSATLIFLYMLLHVLGAHYTYTKVPYEEWSRAIFGTSMSEAFGWERNHYDRLVHLMFGVLMLEPMRELIERFMKVGGKRSLLIAIAFIAVLSKLYELIEWAYAMVLSPEAAELYNGQQGDIYDAQKDMALALAGTCASAITILIIWKLKGEPEYTGCTPSSPARGPG